MALERTVADLDPLRHWGGRVRSPAHTRGAISIDIEIYFQKWYRSSREVARRDRPGTRGLRARRRGSARVSPPAPRDGARAGHRGQDRHDRAARRPPPRRGSRWPVVDPEV